MEYAEALIEAQYKLQLPASFQWKDKQLQCLRALFEGQDLLTVLPTGYGKSLIFQAAPFYCQQRRMWS
jgi:superfamily II DNA or RNA helicase